MDDIEYRLRYLPKFYEDLEEKAVYIAEKLNNPQAANDLIDEVERSIMKRVPIAEAFEAYPSIKEREHTYYRIYVNNFVIYYVVIEDEHLGKIMEVRRFLYNKQNQNIV